MILRGAACLAVLGAVNLIAPHLPAPSRGVQIAALALVSFPLATLFVAAIAPTALSAPMSQIKKPDGFVRTPRAT